MRMTIASGHSFEDYAQEQRLRQRARRKGLKVQKSRRQFGPDNYGQFKLIDAWTNACVIGPRFDATLDDLEAAL